MELRTLGSVQLHAPARAEARIVAAQPKRLALLVYLALAKPAGPKRRDALLALLWPESDQEKGRQVLRQTVYLLRQALGPESLVSRGDEELEVDASVLACDARRFEQLIADGDHRGALALYHGDFLDGFFVPGVSQAFEDWVAATRHRLRVLASGAAWIVAAEDERAGQRSSALHWARRATQLDPDNEAGIRELVLLQQRFGDRVGALRDYERHAERLERELDVAPGPELQRLVESIRAENERGEPPAIVTTDPPKDEIAPPPANETIAPRVAGRFSMALAAGVMLFAVLGLGYAWRGRGDPPRALLAVGSIVDIVSHDSSAESPVASDLLATSLARLGAIHVIPAVRLYDVQAQLRASGGDATLLAAARQAGASQLLSGSMHRDAGGELHFDGQIIALASGTVVQAVRTEGKDLFDLVDRTTDSLAQRLGIPAPAVPIADVTTRSVVAYRLYQEGLRAFYGQDMRTAQGLFRAAESEDSSFAIAAYFDGITGMIFGQADALDVLDRAARLALRAPDRERLLIRYRVAAQHQSPEAMALAETLSVRYPSDLDAMLAVGALRQRAGDWAGAAAVYRAVIRQDSLSLRVPTVRCMACEAFVELWWTDIYADSMTAAERTMREWAASARPERHGSTDDLLSIALERQGRLAEARALWSDVAPPTSTVRRAMMAIRAGDLTAARDTLRMLRRLPGAAAEADWWTALALRNEGRPADALSLPGIDAAQRAAALFEAGRYREAAALHDSAIHALRAGDARAWPRRMSWQLVHLATALAAARDTARLAAIADSVEHIGAESFFGRDPRLHHYVRGLLWLARRDTARAAAEFRTSVWSWTDGYTRANYELAKALYTLGRSREAIYPLQAALRGDLQSSNLYLTRTEVHALLAMVFDAAGMPDSAAAHRERVEKAWKLADPQLPARRTLTALHATSRR